MNWQIRIAKTAEKELGKFPAKDIVRIETALLEMSFNPFTGDVRKMEGAIDSWRRRVGEYRGFLILIRRTKLSMSLTSRDGQAPLTEIINSIFC